MDNNQISITFNSIGTIHSPFHELSNMPIQPCSSFSATGTVEILPQYVAGLKDLAGFSHIILLYYLHLANRVGLTVTPFLDSEPRGVFATRAPQRPNPIGLSVVKLIEVDQNILYVENLDILDGTPLLDLKPYIPEFDSPIEIRLGWLESVIREARTQRSDKRFK